MRFYESVSPYDGTLGGDGFGRVHRSNDPRYIMRITEAARLLNGVRTGVVDPFFLKQALRPTRESAWRMLCQEFPKLFQESMTTSDFSALTSGALDRSLLSAFLAAPSHWPGIAKKATLRDFRTVTRNGMDGASGRFDKVKEKENFNRRAPTEDTPITYKPSKYEAGGEFSWEAMLNDDLGIFSDFTNRLSTGGRRTIDRAVSELYLDADGPHASFYTNANLNKVNTACGASANNPVLSVDGIGEGLTVLYGQVDGDGEPIVIDAVTLVVGPSNYVTAENIMNATLIDANIKGGSTNNRVRVNNWIIQNMKVVRNPYIKTICTNKPNSWFLFADPSEGRPALEIGFLAGFDTPQTYRKAPNTMTAGGGIDANLGDFNTMSQEYKCLLVFGETRISPKSTVGSDGSGS